MSKMGEELEKRLDENKYELLEALRQIAKCEGPYNRDPLTHAENTIGNMATIADKVIAKIEGVSK